MDDKTPKEIFNEYLRRKNLFSDKHNESGSSLEQKAEAEVKKRIRSFLINETALEKIRAYSRILKELAGEPLECMGYLLAPMENGFFSVYDTIYFLDQNVSRTWATGTEEGEEVTLNIIENQGKRVVGVWHSHADLNFDHPSSIDEDMKKFLYLGSMNINNKINIAPRYTLLIDNKGLMVPQLHYQIWLPDRAEFGEVKTIDLEPEIMPFSKEADYFEIELAETVLNNTFINGKQLRSYGHAMDNFKRNAGNYRRRGFSS